jgi:hypothetical protein
MLLGVDLVLVEVSEKRIAPILMVERETMAIFVVFTEVTMKKTASLDVATCEYLDRRFGRTYLLHLPGIRGI